MLKPYVLLHLPAPSHKAVVLWMPISGHAELKLIILSPAVLSALHAHVPLLSLIYHRSFRDPAMSQCIFCGLGQ